jgi:hypothetical protein
MNFKKRFSDMRSSSPSSEFAESAFSISSSSPSFWMLSAALTSSSQFPGFRQNRLGSRLVIVNTLPKHPDEVLHRKKY